MPPSESASDAALEALGFVVFVREFGALHLSSPPPEWLFRLWPAAAAPGAKLRVAEASPFLENFLTGAAECWDAGAGGPATSGPWVERDAHGTELRLEATALTAGGRAMLLVERLGESFETRQSMLQKARETIIADQRLDAEIQKKEILLHCLAEDLSAALGNVITSLRLMELEQNPTKIKHLLALASRATDDQQALMSRVLEVFADELDSFYGEAGARPAGVDLRAVARQVIDTAASQFVEKGVRLKTLDATTGSMTVTADAAHLERVLTNLLENALESTPNGRQVAVRIEEEAETVALYVNDASAKMPPGVRAKLFAKFDTTTGTSPAALLRLHFCRITVENWNGEIGHIPLEGGGNSFWIRLPKAVA